MGPQPVGTIYNYWLKRHSEIIRVWAVQMRLSIDTSFHGEGVTVWTVHTSSHTSTKQWVNIQTHIKIKLFHWAAQAHSKYRRRSPQYPEASKELNTSTKTTQFKWNEAFTQVWHSPSPPHTGYVICTCTIYKDLCSNYIYKSSIFR